MKQFDAIVIGAGPAGSLSAYHLAERGASVLLVDRATFPRDKPCGGAVSIRAAQLLPFSLEPVVEDVVQRFELRLRYGARLEDRTAAPLALLTQRIRLDALLAERAAAAGADFRDGVRATVTRGDGRPEVAVNGWKARSDVVIAADGANGAAARALGLTVRPKYGVALEGNLPFDALDGDERYRGCVILEIGSIPGGYGWVFPKGDHVNVGVWGWEHEAPRLRAHLQQLCLEHGTSLQQLEHLRGHRLPITDLKHAVLTRGRALAVGDAAGLVDPFSGDGMYEAFLSARLAAGAALDLLGGRAAGLEPYGLELRQALGRPLAISSAAKLALDRFPLLVFTAVRSRFVLKAVERVFRNDPQPSGLSRLLRISLGALTALPSRPARRAAALATPAPLPTSGSHLADAASGAIGSAEASRL